MYLSSARLEEEGFLGGWITDRDGVDAAFGGAGWKYLRCWFVVSGRPTKGQLGQAKSAARSSSSLWHRIMWLLKVWKDRVKNQHRLQHSDSVRYFHLVKKKKAATVISMLKWCNTESFKQLTLTKFSFRDALMKTKSLARSVFNVMHHSFFQGIQITSLIYYSCED